MTAIAAMAGSGRRPSERMLEIQRLVMVEGRSTFSVAELFELSQQKVCKIVEKCLLWMAEVLPAKDAALPPGARQALAEQLAAMRLDNLHREAMRAWRASQGEAFTRQQRQGGTTNTRDTTTTRRTQGDTRYLAVAMHIALKAAKLPFTLIPMAGVQHSPEFECPPVGDCSAEAAEQPAEFPAAALEDAATHSEQTAFDIYAKPAAAADAAQVSLFTPVQPGGSAVQRKLPPEPDCGRLLNRHERRARQKMLKRQLRKAK